MEGDATKATDLNNYNSKGGVNLQTQILDEDGKGEGFPSPLPLLSYYEQRKVQDPSAAKTGTGLPMLNNSPEFIPDVEPYEAVAVPRESILEDCIRRETERLAFQETLLNKVVYDCIDPSPFNQDKDPPSNGDLKQFYYPIDATDTTLVFESRFESGNLRRAIQINEFEYDLILKSDYNTRGNTQWYYFSIANTKANQTYRFNIINMMKPDSLYNAGMKTCVYSTKDAENFHKGWRRDGFDICYYQNNMKKKIGGYYYTLTFAITVTNEKDTVYIAHCYPYTYSDLNKYLNLLLADPKKRNRIRRKTLCQTVAGNSCDVLTITSFLTEAESFRARKGIALFARVHPGETNSSWMMKGLIDYLTGPTLDAKILRDNFIFKIIPMLNPDGVINGSYRCGLAGVDLNRCWAEPSRKLHPTIFNAKAMLKQFCTEAEVVLTCDFHGHSRKKNIFMYGCVGKNGNKEKIFPKLMEKTSEIFSFSDCVFGMQKTKESTARIVIYREMGIINSFTLESSFCGANYGKHADFHFNPEHLQEVGHDFCDAILDFCDPDQIKVRMAIEELDILFPGTEEEEVEEIVEDVVVEEDNGKKKKKKKKVVIKKKMSTTKAKKEK